MTGSVFFVLEIIGTIAFAISGAIIAMENEMDIFGVCVLGLTTAVGGGIMRDLILGCTPPTTFIKPVYALVALGTSLFMFLPFVQKMLAKNKKVYDFSLRIADAIGLGVFSVIGVQAAISSAPDNLWLLLFVGVITGVGGGVLRDIMAGHTPYIFVKHFYACASLIGTAACVLLWKFVGEEWAMILGASLVILLRLLAAQFRWRLPKAKILTLLREDGLQSQEEETQEEK